MEYFEYDEEKNKDVKDALDWCIWLSKVKDPGPALLAAKAHSTTLLNAYEAMMCELHNYEYGSP